MKSPSGLNIADLRTDLKALGLPSDGLKAALVVRLEKALARNKGRAAKKKS
jgi:hypothetical protein